MANLESATSHEETNKTPLTSAASRHYNIPSTQRSSPQRCRVYYFYKGNGLTRKAEIRSTDNNLYRLVADVHRHKPSIIQVQEGKGSAPASLGTLSFPPTHNGFQIRVPQMSEQLVQVKARVGYPHPFSYEFEIPTPARLNSWSLVWKRQGNTTTTRGYHLHDAFTDELLASWSLVSGEKHQILLQWHVEPRNYEEEIIVMLSFLGVVTRLKLHGKDYSGLPDGLLRYNGFWLMAILGTAAVAS